MVARVPSSKRMTRLAQFSTSTGFALIHWCAPAWRASSDASLCIRSAVSATTETARMPLPRRTWPSHCLRCRHAPTECTPIRSSTPPPVDFHSRENTELEPEWFSSARNSSTEPLAAAIKPAHLVNRRGVNPVFRIAKAHARARHRRAHRLGIPPRALPHFLARHHAAQSARGRPARQNSR